MSRPLQWPHVYSRVNAGGSTTYVVDGGLVVLAGGGKKRHRYYCKTKKVADAKAHEMRVQRDQHGTVVSQKLSAATDELKECLALIQASELGSLKDAVLLAIRAKAGAFPTSSTSKTTPPPAVTESSTTPSKLTGEVITEYITARIEAKKGQSDSRHRQGRLLGRMEGLGFHVRAEASLTTLTADVVKSSAIEGEQLDAEAVRSSIARRLGLDVGGGLRGGASYPR